MAKYPCGYQTFSFLQKEALLFIVLNICKIQHFSTFGLNQDDHAQAVVIFLSSNHFFLLWNLCFTSLYYKLRGWTNIWMGKNGKDQGVKTYKNFFWSDRHYHFPLPLIYLVFYNDWQKFKLEKKVKSLDRCVKICI